MSYNGVDISNNNGYVDVGKLKSAGYSFIIAKATEGTSFIDKYFQNFIQQAKSLNLVTGAYHFARFRDIESAKNEAEFFKTVALQENPDFLVLDLEYEGAEGDLTAATNAFMSSIKATSLPILLYSYPAFIKEHLDTTVQQYLLWIAHYNVSQPDIWCWNKYSIWQYTANENGFDANFMSDEFYNLVINYKNNLIKEEKKVDYLVVYGKKDDEPLAKILSEKIYRQVGIGVPVLDADMKFDYSTVKRVIAVGGVGELPWSSYIRKEDILSGKDFNESLELVNNFKI